MLLRLKGRFDGHAAHSLVRRLDRAGAWRVLIDFAAVSTYEDQSFGILSEALRRHGDRVALTGLRDQHLRLLAGLGVDAAANP